MIEEVALDGVSKLATAIEADEKGPFFLGAGYENGKDIHEHEQDVVQRINSELASRSLLSTVAYDPEMSRQFSNDLYEAAQGHVPRQVMIAYKRIDTPQN